MPLLIVVGVDLCLGVPQKFGPGQAGDDAEHAGLHRLAVVAAAAGAAVAPGAAVSPAAGSLASSPHAVASRPTAHAGRRSVVVSS